MVKMRYCPLQTNITIVNGMVALHYYRRIILDKRKESGVVKFQQKINPTMPGEKESGEFEVSSENTFANTLSEEDYALYKNWIKDVLHLTPAVVEFVKKDGSIRKMNCTTSKEFIPSQPVKESKSNRPANEDVLAVYDLEINAWRSFRFDSVRSVTILMGDKNETE